MGFPQIKVLKFEGTKYKTVPFEEFCRLTLREILSVHSDYILRIGKGLFATGDETLKSARKRAPENAFPFHEVIHCALPNWSSEFMDMKLVNLPLQHHTEEKPEQLERIIQQVKAIFPGARELSPEETEGILPKLKLAEWESEK